MQTQIMVMLILLTLTACGTANSDSTRAELIPSPVSGYKCFVIKDNDGKSIGGNCAKD